MTDRRMWESGQSYEPLSVELCHSAIFTPWSRLTVGGHSCFIFWRIHSLHPSTHARSLPRLDKRAVVRGYHRRRKNLGTWIVSNAMHLRWKKTSEGQGRAVSLRRTTNHINEGKKRHVETDLRIGELVEGVRTDAYSAQRLCALMP